MASFFNGKTLQWALACCMGFALLSAMPQYGGLKIIERPIIPTDFRGVAQVLLFFPILAFQLTHFRSAISWSWKSRLVEFFLLCSIIAYSHFPAPFFDYVWDVFLIESIFVVLLSRMFLLRQGWERYYLWPLRLLLFKLMFCMGVVKFLHGMPEWRNGMALQSFWSNQPMPGVLAWHAAQLPVTIQKFMVSFVFLAEIPGPFLIFFGRRARTFYFLVNLLLQLGIFFVGNYGFFNLLTIIVSLSLFDVVPESEYGKTRPASNERLDNALRKSVFFGGTLVLAGWLITSGWYVYMCLFPVKTYLHETSWIFLKNQEQQEISTPVKTMLQVYGAAKASNPFALFGMIAKYRMEIAIEASLDGKHWERFDFKVKPQEVNTAPVWYAPHHWRLDHQMYYESFRIRAPELHAKYSYFLGVKWIHRLANALFSGDHEVLKLFRMTPSWGIPPKLLRFTYMYYEFTNYEEHSATGAYWKQTTPHRNQFFEQRFSAIDIDKLP